MSAAPHNRGGAPVGQVAHMEGLEAASVLYLRLWCDSAGSRQAVRDDFAQALGPDHGGAAADAWDALMELCTEHCRRPLMRHAVTCRCLGADESCFANFIAAAATGAREDAMLMATLIVRADMAPVFTSLACECGLALKCMALAAPRDMARRAAAPATLH
ncbi:hypothetical protein DC366_11375 [Pelagivirga sediminicola]|uniref:Uncharacterized protein n=1 Tax=Pelagivirga sediminicola TaxID=2170575 RepID=A0A2T7G5M9_9RHOB|nr:hypothetical protein [Pelagivirga sediminicola]PVA09724.1 hypothetical protein DC366_11375 [Pelagivirga sediminicola]